MANIPWKELALGTPPTSLNFLASIVAWYQKPRPNLGSPNRCARTFPKLSSLRRCKVGLAATSPGFASNLFERLLQRAGDDRERLPIGNSMGLHPNEKGTVGGGETGMFLLTSTSGALTGQGVL